ncbi:MAG: branched-chain amino acid ABC transporter permease [Chthoniobacterales bacterium]
MKNYIPHLALFAALAGAAVLQFFSPQLDDYAASILVLIGINIVLAVSLNLVNGHTGQFSLGHAGFMAAGAYGSAMVTLSFAPIVAAAGPWAEGALFAGSLLLGGAVAALCGLLVGLPSLRLRGDYLAIVTLGFGEIIRVVIQNTESLGGARGLEGIRPYTTLFWTFAIAALTVYVVACLVNSTYGRGFIAVRDDEIAAESMGIHTVKYKVVAFVVGAFFAGLAGGLYAHFITFIAPEGFNFLKSVDVVVMVILGGMGSTPGVVAAAILLTLLNEGLRDFEQYRMIVFALLLIVIMIVRPQGLLGNFRGWPKRKAGA